MLYTSKKIYVGESEIAKAGRGIFARVDIEKDEVIEICPVIEIPEQEIDMACKTVLKNYYFLWGSDFKSVAIALGFGSLYNHSYSPNATYIKKVAEEVIEFVALDTISKDAEITVNYNFGNPDDKSPLWISEIPPYEEP